MGCSILISNEKVRADIYAHNGTGLILTAQFNNNNNNSNNNNNIFIVHCFV